MLFLLYMDLLYEWKKSVTHYISMDCKHKNIKLYGFRFYLEIVERMSEEGGQYGNALRK